MRLGVTMPIEDAMSAPQLVRLAQTAESCGVDTVLCGEVAGPEVMSLLGAIAASTERIRLASGIIASYTRTPTLTAMGFATLSSLAPGRVVAGVGASSPIVVGRWHGLEFASPYQRTKEFVEALRLCLGGGKVEYDGDHVAVHDFRLAIDPEQRVPIWLAAMNPQMLRLAGAIADGVFLTWCRPDEIAAKLAEVHAGARAAGRDPSDVEVICSFWGYSGPLVDQAIDRLRRVVLSYATVPTHAAAFVEAFPSLAEATDAWNAGDRRAALSLVDESVVHDLCAVSTDGSRTADFARRYDEAGVDLPVVLAIGAGQGDHEGPFSTVRDAARRLGLVSPESSTSS